MREIGAGQRAGAGAALGQSLLQLGDRGVFDADIFLCGHATA
jgi:hypothetical protein